MEIGKLQPGSTLFTSPSAQAPKADDTPQLQGDSVQLSASSRPSKRKSTKPHKPSTPKNEPSDPSTPKTKWTIMLYSAADNNLTSYMVDDVKELERVGSDPNTNLIVQLDQGGTNCKRYFLEKNTSSNQITSPVLADMGKTDMADPKVLADFIKWGMKNYPAQHYALIISDHGNGWKGAAEDDSHGTWMKMPTIEEGLKIAEEGTKEKIDVVGFDACLMANTEVAYQLKDRADYMIASEQTEGADGWPYVKIFSGKAIRALQTALRKRIDLDPKDFAIKVVTEAQTHPATNTMSAADLATMPDLTKATDVLADGIMATKTAKDVLKAIARKTQSFYGYKDLGDFCDRIVKSADIKDQALKSAAKGVLDALAKTVIAEEHSSNYAGAHGLTIEIPTYGGTSSDYGELAFAKDSKWKKAMDHMNS